MLVANHIATEVPTQDLFVCRQMVKQRPKSGLMRLNLARALLTANYPGEAVEQCAMSLELAPSLRDAAWFLASLLQRYELNESIKVSARSLRTAMQYIDVDRQALCTAAIASLKHALPLKDIVAEGPIEGWVTVAHRILRGKGRRILQNRLFHAALTVGVNTDIEVEFLLTALRRALLDKPELLRERPIYEFACVLIQQCANNGYVFHASDEENEKLVALQFNPEDVFEGKKSATCDFILASLYAPLTTLIDPTLAARGCDQIASRALRLVIALAMDTVREEAEITAHLPELTPVTNNTSRRVAKQYCTAPYPQWFSLQVPERNTARRVLGNYFSNAETNRLKASCDVLIAGAGTCQQAVHSAITYGAHAQMVAIDVSAPSLAYGARMAKRLGVKNIDFATADILRLREIDQMFDVIECVGVLHHMADPYAAWRILVEKLQPGGLMKIGLYSEIARRTIAALSDDPEWPGTNASDGALRTFRHRLMQRVHEEPRSNLTASIDFFATSDFRDLALHVKEQHCTLPEIRDFFASCDLEFRGFILPPAVHQMYFEMFPGDAVPGLLDNWREFEQTHPNTFNGMYMFWCRRREVGE